VLWVSDKYANQRQISIDEGYLRFNAFQKSGAQIPGCALSNWHTRSFFQKQAVHNRGQQPLLSSKAPKQRHLAQSGFRRDSSGCGSFQSAAD
jgi:hypothetical protein